MHGNELQTPISPPVPRSNPFSPNNSKAFLLPSVRAPVRGDLRAVLPGPRAVRSPDSISTPAFSERNEDMDVDSHTFPRTMTKGKGRLEPQIPLTGTAVSDPTAVRI